MTERDRAIAIIATTDPIYNTGCGYGDMCIYRCMLAAQHDYQHATTCPWIIFNAVPEVAKAVAEYKSEKAAEAQAKVDAERAKEREADLAEIKRLKEKQGV